MHACMRIYFDTMHGETVCAEVVCEVVAGEPAWCEVLVHACVTEFDSALACLTHLR